MVLLKDSAQAVEAGFVRDSVGGIEESSNLVSLGGLADTPLWIFYRGKDTYDDLRQLQGKRIVIGPEGSGVRKFSLELLKVAGVTRFPTELSLLHLNENLVGRRDSNSLQGTRKTPSAKLLVPITQRNASEFFSRPLRVVPYRPLPAAAA